MRTVCAEMLEKRMLLAAAVPGFAEEAYADDLHRPTTMAFAPDGRLFVAEQTGALRLLRDGQVQPTPFLTVPAVFASERGLLGVAFDPDFAANRHVYVYWTTNVGGAHNKISRFTADAANPDVAVSSSRVDLLDLPPLGGTSHNGGALHFGPDGKLYVAVGENTMGSRAQDPNDPFGKMLRINKDGSVPTDNPFYNQNTGLGRAVWAMGLRNPFTFSFQPGTGRMFINDVGQDTWEEINEGAAGANYGWPISEGPTSDTRFRGPVFAYRHGNESVDGGVIIGGTFYSPPDGAPGAFPAEWNGRYFYGDGRARHVRYFDPNDPPPPGTPAANFATNLQYVVDIDVGPDGALYVLSRGAGYDVVQEPGRVLRYSYTGSAAPSIGAHPRAVTVALEDPVTFTVEASGGAPLQYQWQRDGQDIPGATSAAYTLPAAAAADNGAAFRVVVSNAAGSVTSEPAALTVSNSRPPAPFITTPDAGSLFTAGRRVTFSGGASDPEDGDLRAANLTWTVSYFTGGLERPFLPETSGVAGGAFTPETRTPYLQPDVFYRVRLTATDSSGIARSTFVDVLARTANITLNSNVPGIQLTLDGVPVNTPHTVTGVAGLSRPLGAPLRQTLNGVVHDFAGWSDGGAAEHDAVTPESDVTYTAEYRPRVAVASGPDFVAAVVETPGAPGGRPVVAGRRGSAVLRFSNLGPAPFSGRSKVGLYLSTDPTLDETDLPVAAPNRRVRLAAGASRSLRLRFAYPSAAAGSYYLLAEADATNAVPETDESNNTAASAAPIRIDPALPDLSGSFAVSTPAALSPGGTGRVTLAVLNSGNVAAKGPLELTLRAATDAAGANVAATLATFTRTVRLEPRARQRLRLRFTLPPDLAAGTYYLSASIDSAGRLSEANEADNLVVSPSPFTVA